MNRLKGFACIFLLIFASACQRTNREIEPSVIEKPATEKVVAVQVDNIKGDFDYNQNGLDDYTDFVKGAREDAKNHPAYIPDYISENNGYPGPDQGVCTDVIWRAFREGGFSLRTMLNEDIKRRLEDYSNIKDGPNPNIDFRRVKTLRPFFEKYADKLEIEMTDPSQWQPGDIVIFSPRDFHIGLLSDRRNSQGYPYVFHNMGQKDREEDYLTKKKGEITGHYRFNASNIPPEILKPWVQGEDGRP